MAQEHGHPAAHYKVTHQEQLEDYSPQDGSRTSRWLVHLEHGDGTKSTVEVPDHLYTAENVHQLASEQANEVARVAALPASVTEHQQAG